jgi:hypothetical protein
MQRLGESPVSGQNEIPFDQTIVFRTAVDMILKQMHDANNEKYRRQVANAVLYIAGENRYDAPTLAELAIQKLNESLRRGEVVR